jgi:hypothetical protein
MTELSASFEIDVEHLKDLGVVDANSPKSMDIFASGKLNSNERLYFSLWGSKFLSTASFEAQEKNLPTRRRRGCGLLRCFRQFVGD